VQSVLWNGKRRLVFFDGTDEVKNTEEPGTEADLLKVEVVDEVKASEAEEHKSGEKADTSAADEEHEKADEPGGELSVDVDKDSK